MQAMVRQAYENTPQISFGMPSVSIKSYPESETSGQRIYAFFFVYPESPVSLLAKQKLMAERVAAFIASNQNLNDFGYVQMVIEQLRSQVQQEGDASAYSALINAVADSEGIHRAAQYLLQARNINCLPVNGQYAGQEKLWLLVQIDDVWQHLDITQEGSRLRGDIGMQSLGYAWQTVLPSCPELD